MNNNIVSYSSIIKTSVDVFEKKKFEDERKNILEEDLQKKLEKSYNYNYNFLPIYNQIYNRKNTIKWLCQKNNSDLFNYDYCVILFDLLMAHINKHNYSIRIPEHILFAKFLSLIFLLSYNRV
jgi:hypothetical protein